MEDQNLNIFERLSTDSQADKFSPIINSNKTEFSFVSDEGNGDENIFESLSKNKGNDSFSFLDTVKDVGEQIVSKGTQGLFGSYGNTFDLLGIQSKENLLPGQKERLQNSGDLDLGLDDELLPSYSRLPNSQDIKKIIKEGTGIDEGKTPAGRIAGRGAEFLGEGISIPVGGIKGLASLGLSGLAGQTLRETGAPEALASGTEILGSILPSAILKKVMPRGHEAKSITDAGRALGLTEKQITPLIQSEGKSTLLSKVARKGERTKNSFASIKESLGDSYQNIKQNVSRMGNVNVANQRILTNKFQAIRDDLDKTIKASPDKEAAIKFIDDSINRIASSGATPEELINFWQDINKSVKWNSIQGGKKSLSRLKEPILEVLNNVSPQAAKDFEMTNQLYSKYSQISKKLKPDIVDSFLNKGEIVSIAPTAMALVYGNPWPLTSLAAESALRTLASEMLINPYFQNLANKLVQNFNQGSFKGVKDLVKNAKELLDRKHPNENWEFLLEN